MMKRYLLALLAVTLSMTLISMCVMWFWPQYFLTVMPLLALYFFIVTGTQHFIVTKSMYRSPKIFIQVFLGSIVGVLFLHLAVLAIYLFTHTAQARLFTIAFGIGYTVSLFFETVALVQFVKRERTRRMQEK